MKKPELPSIDFREMLRDFENLDPQDPGAWPVAPRVTVLVGLLVILLLAGWWFVWADQLDALESKGHEEQRLKDQFVAKKMQAVNLDLYVQQLEMCIRDRF